MKKFTVLAFTLTVMLVISGCGEYDRVEQTATNTYDATLYDEFYLETGNGQIQTSVTTDSVITVTLTRWTSGIDARSHLDDISVTVDEDTVTGALTITVILPTITTRSYGCDAVVSLPEDIYVALSSSNGNVEVDGHQAGLYLHSSNGSIDMSRTAGDADIETSNEGITVDMHEGNIAGHTSNGKVTADVVMPDSAGYCLLSSSNGAMTVAVPDSVGAEILLETSNGNISVDSDLHVEVIDIDDDRFEGRMGDGSGEIDLDTSNGDVTLKKL